MGAIYLSPRALMKTNHLGPRPHEIGHECTSTKPAASPCAHHERRNAPEGPASSSPLPGIRTIRVEALPVSQERTPARRDRSSVHTKLLRSAVQCAAAPQSALG